MAVGRIGTNALHRTTLDNMSRVNESLSNLQTQISSGLKSQTFSGIDSRAEQFLDLESKMRGAQNYLENNKVAQTRIEATALAVEQVIDSANDIVNLIVLRRNPVAAEGLSFAEQLRAKWRGLTSQLNASSGGRFLFSGTQTDSPAVDETNFPTLITDGVPDDGYYTGSKEDMTLRAQDNFEITYNVRADASGFQKIFAGIATAMEGHAAKDDEILQDALQFLQDGIKEVITIQTTVNSNKVAVEQINDRHESQRIYWKGIVEEISSTDILAVSTRVSIDQAMLQAAFGTFARLQSMKLSDYLR